MLKFKIPPALFFIAFLVGIFSGAACQRAPKFSAADPPCRDGLIVIEPQPDAPVHLSVLATKCPNPYFPLVSFRVESSNGQPINRYEVRMITTYDGVYDSYSMVSAAAGDPGGAVLTKGTTSFDSLSVILKRGWFKDPEVKLTLSVWAVTLTNGTVWNRAASAR